MEFAAQKSNLLRYFIYLPMSGASGYFSVIPIIFFWGGEGLEGAGPVTLG